eukprot:scaffold43978_cov66-Phaeocystis_antarctica.AAC.1
MPEVFVVPQLVAHNLFSLLLPLKERHASGAAPATSAEGATRVPALFLSFHAAECFAFHVSECFQPRFRKSLTRL